MRSRWWAVAGLLAAFVLCYAAFVCTPVGQRVDAAAFGQLPELNSAFPALFRDSRIVVPGVFGVLAGVGAIRALVQRRWGEVIRVIVFVALSSLLAVVAKPLLPRPQFGAAGYSWNTFPSGHLAVTLALICAALRLAPGRLATPPARTVLWVIAAAFGWGLVLSYAHRQADVVGGALIVATVLAAEGAVATAAAARAMPRPAQQQAAQPAAVPARAQPRNGAPVTPAAWRAVALAALAGVAIQVLADYLPGWEVLRFVSATGTVLIIAASCGVALLLVPSDRDGDPVERLVLVGDARDVERASAD